ncbi:hypothetical protein [Microcoleus sp. N9_A1]|uniref:hypothetical protein n=1 Tax=Microcoleus sp. N9_A1 TaxID=3055380 RepID=UPI002FD201DC
MNLEFVLNEEGRRQEAGGRREEAEGRRIEEEGRSQNKGFYKYEMLPKRQEELSQ